MKKTAIILCGVILLIMLAFGVLESLLAPIFGNNGVIVMYTIAALILIILYVKASKDAKKEEAERAAKGEGKLEILPEEETAVDYSELIGDEWKNSDED